MRKLVRYQTVKHDKGHSEVLQIECEVSGTHLNVNLADGAKYADVREQVLRWDRVQQKWSDLMQPTAPCLHGAVELLLTGDQHKPCASCNQQAFKTTTSVAEGKRKTPQKIASKGTKICKKMPPLWGPKMDPFWGLVCFKKIMADPKTGPFLDPKTGTFFCIFLRLLMQFFVGFSVCLLLRMLYSYMPLD